MPVASATGRLTRGRHGADGVPVTILIDPPVWSARGRRWSHLASDSSPGELHVFAEGLRVPRRAFEGDHYDLPEERYQQAVAAGAVPVSSRELLRRLQVSGLRRAKRRGERVVATCAGPDGRHRLDSLVSELPPPARIGAAHLVLIAAGDLLVAPDGKGFRVPALRLTGDAPAVSGDGDAPAGAGRHPGARALAAMLVGPAVAKVPLRQVGYLRHVPHGRQRPAFAELVLRCPDLAAVLGAARSAAHQPQAPWAWVPAHHAAALLPSSLAPVALPEHPQPD